MDNVRHLTLAMFKKCDIQMNLRAFLQQLLCVWRHECRSYDRLLYCLFRNICESRTTVLLETHATEEIPKECTYINHVHVLINK